MTKPTNTNRAEDIKNQVNNITSQEIEQLLSYLNAKQDNTQIHAKNQPAFSSPVQTSRLNTMPYCPCCGSTNIKKNGHSKGGLQRFLCKNENCEKPCFNAETGTALSGLHKELETFRQFINLTLDKLTLRKIQNKMGIHRNTAFTWRHKVLFAMIEIESTYKVSGIVEASMTTVPVSRKGKKTAAKPRMRGGEHDKDVYILNFKDSDGNIVSKSISIGEIDDDKLLKVLLESVVEGSFICTDIEIKDKFCMQVLGNGYNHKQFIGSDTNSDLYSIDKVKEYSRELKELIIDNYHGVSTKYIDHYLVLNRLIDENKDGKKSREELVNEILLKCCKITKTLKKNDFKDIKAKFDK